MNVFELNAIETSAKIARIEEQNKQIEIRLSRLEKWIDTWQEVLLHLAKRAEEAKSNNATLIIREAINPFADTTTVEQLLHMLESECPISTVLDAISKKELTKEESDRLVSDLKGIVRDAINTLAILDTVKEL